VRTQAIPALPPPPLQHHVGHPERGSERDCFAIAEAKVAALRQHRARSIGADREAHQDRRYAQRAWREQSWAERERAVASSLLN
jgi:hypothetical protein